MRRLILLSTLLLLALAAPAAAAPVTGEVLDPADGAGSAAQDLEWARASVDSATGAFEVGIRLRAPISAEEGGWGALHGVLYAHDPARPGTCPTNHDTATQLGRWGASTHPDQGYVFLGSAGAPLAGGTRSISPGGRELHFALTAPGLVGREAGCLLLSLSRKRPLDTAALVLRAPGAPAPSEPEVQSPVIVLASPGVPVLRVSRARPAKLRLRGFLTPVALQARAVRRPGGPALLRGSFDTAARTPVAMPLRLTRAGRRALAGRRSLRARLTITATTPGAHPGVRTVPVVLRRR